MPCKSGGLLNSNKPAALFLAKSRDWLLCSKPISQISVWILGAVDSVISVSLCVCDIVLDGHDCVCGLVHFQPFGWCLISGHNAYVSFTNRERICMVGSICLPTLSHGIQSKVSVYFSVLNRG